MTVGIGSGGAGSLLSFLLCSGIHPQQAATWA
jgi:hypothetical protein